MLRYLLILQLRQKLPALYHARDTEEFYLFDEGKVYSVSDETLARRTRILSSSVWEQEVKDILILVDTFAYGNKGIPRYFLRGNMKTKVVIASPPQERWWTVGRQNQSKARAVYMNPYSTAEARLLYVKSTSIILLLFLR